MSSFGLQELGNFENSDLKIDHSTSRGGKERTRTTKIEKILNKQSLRQQQHFFFMLLTELNPT